MNYKILKTMGRTKNLRTHPVRDYDAMRREYEAWEQMEKEGLVKRPKKQFKRTKLPFEK
jgi:hypothetical protein